MIIYSTFDETAQDNHEDYLFDFDPDDVEWDGEGYEESELDD